MKRTIILLAICASSLIAKGQSEVDADQLGAWYMYFVQKKFGDSRFGIQGDYQFRFWRPGSDLEQILLRTGLTYKPRNADVLFTLGYVSITTGDYGESTATVHENRIYQEALIPQKLGSRFMLTHRFRYEQRWVGDQDFRTRYRYNIFVNVPLNNTSLEKNTVYLALYNEIFINGERDIGAGSDRIQFFDRNRSYAALGYSIRDNLRVQLGWMKQTTVDWSKGQLQIGFHHNF